MDAMFWYWYFTLMDPIPSHESQLFIVLGKIKEINMVHIISAQRQHINIVTWTC